MSLEPLLQRSFLQIHLKNISLVNKGKISAVETTLGVIVQARNYLEVDQPRLHLFQELEVRSIEAQMGRYLEKPSQSYHRTKVSQRKHAPHKKYADVNPGDHFEKPKMSLRNTDASDRFFGVAGDRLR